MVSKTKIAYIRSLHNKSTRLEEGIFLVEGRKCMSEFMDSDFEIVEGLFTEDFANQEKYKFPYHIVTEMELSRITTLSSNDSGLLLVKIRPNTAPKVKKNELILILDKINDPGNLGTIIRIADWYGVSQIICSPDTVDCYNPKVLMATMGSFTRVSICYTDLEEYLRNIKIQNIGECLDVHYEGEWCRFSPGKGGVRGGYTEYNPTLLEYAKENRKIANDMEKNMWFLLRGGKLGYKFHRQKPIGCYIVDFYSPSLQLVIEIDGESHIDTLQYDKKRTEYLNSLGMHVLRFTNLEVAKNLEGVQENIRNWIQNIEEYMNVTPPNLPFSGGGPKIYGAYLNGENIRTKKFTTRGGYLVIGSEAHGISISLEQYITDRVTIPRFGLAESLNAGVATAVILERMAG